MKNAIYVMIGLTIGAVLVTFLSLSYLSHALPGLIAQNVSGSPPATSSPLTPQMAAVRQDIIDGIDDLQKQGVHAPSADSIISKLTPADLQALSVYAEADAAAWKNAGTNPNPPMPQIDPKTCGLSPMAMVALSVVLEHVRIQGQEEQKKSLENVAAVDLSGRPPPADAPTPEEAAAYREEAETNKFESPLPPSHLQPILRDSSSLDRTEDNWLSRLIVQDIAGQVILGLHLKQPLAKLFPQVDVDDDDPARGHIRVHLMQWIDDPQMPSQRLNQALPIDFAWDGEGYSVLAEYLIGTHPLPPPAPDPAAAQLLHDLLDLTGPRLAREDVRLSALLQKNPLEASTQGEAALLLVAMAWRENAGDFGDTRELLCKAAGHLALAFAVDSLQKQPPDWNARVAEIALRVFAGRETDALSRIDSILAQQDTPDDVKTWLSTLRFRSTNDWRAAKVNAKSPLLVKIAWFQVLCEDLRDVAAVAQLDKLGNLEPVPDWGRALLNRKYFSVDTGNRFGQSSLALELKEILAISQAEGCPLADDSAITAALTKSQDDTVLTDPAGNLAVSVIGPDTFFAASRRHILNTIEKIDYYLRTMLGSPDEAAVFEAQMTTTLGRLPHWDIVSLKFPPPNTAPSQYLYDVLRGRGASWLVTELPAALASKEFWGDWADVRFLNDFYQSGEPCGTAYDLPRRLDLLEQLHIPPRWHLANDAQTPATAPDAKRGYLEKLQGIDPDSCPLAQALVDFSHGIGTGPSCDQALAALKRFMDYCISPFDHLLNATPSFEFSDSDLEMLYTQEARLVPDSYFDLAKLLRKEGRVDDAAEADRKGAAQAYDQVGMANSIQPLVDYDLAHGKTDEALQVAKRADQVYSASGIYAYYSVLENLNRLDEAETCANDLKDRYGYDYPLHRLYLRHPDHFPAQVAALQKAAFPQGQTSVSLNSFSSPPDKGVVFTSSTPELNNAGLREGDIVVALDSIKTESTDQYDFVHGQKSDDLDLIVWQDGQYHEIHASPPHGSFGVDIDNYPRN